MMHQRIGKKIFIYLFIFFILVTITNKKISLDLKITEFNITSSYDLDIKKIQSDLKNFSNINILSFNKKEIIDIIKRNKAVEEFKVLKVYPSTLNFEIKKTKFLAITKKNNLDYLVGANGNLIEIDDETYNLPYIFGKIDVKNFLIFKDLIDNSKIKFDNIENFFYFNSNRWDIVNKQGLILKLPNNITIEKLNLIHKIIKDERFKNLKIIDFRQNDLMVINE